MTGLAPALRSQLNYILGFEPSQFHARDRASLFLVVDMSRLMALDPEWNQVLRAMDEKHKPDVREKAKETT
jgi:hypothetical protein